MKRKFEIAVACFGMLMFGAFMGVMGGTLLAGVLSIFLTPTHALVSGWTIVAVIAMVAIYPDTLGETLKLQGEAK